MTHKGPNAIWRKGNENFNQLELCVFALKGEHNLYSLVPNILVCIYIDQKWIYINLQSASSPVEHCSNHSLTWMSKNHLKHHFIPCPKLTFDDISGHFRWLFGCPKFTFDHISGHFRSIRNLILAAVGHLKLFTKWLPSAILDVWSHFWPFQIDTQLNFLGIFLKLVRDIWTSNACAKFDELSLNPSTVIARTRRLRCWWKHNIPGNLAA